MPNSDTNELRSRLSGAVDEDTGRSIDVAEGPFVMQLEFTDPYVYLALPEIVLDLATADFDVTNATVTGVENWGSASGVYRVKRDADDAGRARDDRPAGEPGKGRRRGDLVERRQQLHPRQHRVQHGRAGDRRAGFERRPVGGRGVDGGVRGRAGRAPGQRLARRPPPVQRGPEHGLPDLAEQGRHGSGRQHVGGEAGKRPQRPVEYHGLAGVGRAGDAAGRVAGRVRRGRSGVHGGRPVLVELAVGDDPGSGQRPETDGIRRGRRPRGL